MINTVIPQSTLIPALTGANSFLGRAQWPDFLGLLPEEMDPRGASRSFSLAALVLDHVLSVTVRERRPAQPRS